MRLFSRIVNGVLVIAAFAVPLLVFMWFLAGGQQPSTLISPTASTSQPIAIATEYSLSPMPPETPTAIPYPPPPLLTTTPQNTPSPVPTPTPTIKPTPIPTASALPEGAAVLYKEVQASNVVIWAASASDPNIRLPILTLKDESQFGMRVSISHAKTRIAYTQLPLGHGNNPLAAELWLTELDGSKQLRLAGQVDIGRYINYPMWSPDDRQIAFSRQTALEAPYVQSIAIVDVATYKEQTLVTASDAEWLWPLDWSPDGKYFYYLLGSKSQVELRRVNLDQDNASESIRPIVSEMAPRCYFLSSDGSQLLCTVMQSREPLNYAVVVVPTDSSKPSETVASGAQDELYNPIWTPNGQEIILNIPSSTLSGQAELRSIQLQGKQEKTISVASEGILVPQGWSPDGQWVVVAKFMSSGAGLLVISRDGIETRNVLSATEIEFIGWLK